MADPTNRRNFLRHTVVSPVAAALLAPLEPVQQAGGAEWRNRQPGMAYRRLGRTGLMVSEVVCGGDPIGTHNYEHLNLALEMGLNYLDMAPAYGDGDCETGYGRFLGGSAKRDKVFLTTKISSYSGVRDRLYQDIFKALPGEKQSAIRKRAAEMRRESLAEKPGYYLDYFPGQHRQFDPIYLSNAMMPDYGHRVEGSPEFRKAITDSLEGSLRRVGTDHFDIMMCPHGACTPEELDSPEIHETFLGLKKQGKVRFLGVTSHNDPAGILRKAAQLGHYDVVMIAYNVINGGYLEQAILHASEKQVGIIAMKVAHSVATHHKELQPVPQWRIEMVNRVVPGDMKPPVKAYIWSLQNPRVSAVISNLWDETYIRENLSVAGKRVELQPA